MSCLVGWVKEWPFRQFSWIAIPCSHRRKSHSNLFNFFFLPMLPFFFVFSRTPSPASIYSNVLRTAAPPATYAALVQLPKSLCSSALLAETSLSSPWSPIWLFPSWSAALPASPTSPRPVPLFLIRNTAPPHRICPSPPSRSQLLSSQIFRYSPKSALFTQIL